MKALVVYASRLGSTEGIAVRIAQTLGRAGIDVTIQPAAQPLDVVPFDAVIVGGGVYAQRWHRDAIEFVRKYGPELSERPTWLFGSGPVGNTATQSEPVETTDMAELAETIHARGDRMFFGALDRSMIDGSDLGMLEKAVAKRFIPEGDWRDWDHIEAWARGIASELLGHARRVPVEALL